MGFGCTDKNGQGDKFWTLCDTEGRTIVATPYTATINREDVNSNTKTYTVPSGYEWTIKSLLIVLTTVTLPGDRKLVVSILDGGGNMIARFRAGIVQAINTTYYYQFGPGLPLSAAIVVDMAYVPMHEFVVLAGYSIVIEDSANIAAAYDTMKTNLEYLSRVVPD